jgi:lysine-arginine-ornithine-binding protein
MFSRIMMGVALAASLFALTQPNLARADDAPLKIATEGAFEPFNYTDASGNVVGFDIDLTNAILDRAGLKGEWIRQDWDGLIPGLLAGKFDLISASVSITEERKKKVDFTAPIYRTSIRFVAAKNTLTSETPDALAGKVLGAQRATIAATYLKDSYPNSEIKLYDTQDALRLDLTAGRIDALLADQVAVSRGFLGTPEAAGFTFFGEAIKVGDGIGIVVPKGKDELRKKLNEGIEKVRADGTFDKLTEKYFPGFDLR